MDLLFVSLSMENFIECQFDSNYLIGDNGTVRSLLPRTIARYKDGVISGGVKADGYKIYFIGGKWYYAHRLVAQHYCANPNDYNEVNHIDGVKGNNHYTNLEWCTRRENQRHMRQVLGKRGPTGKDHWKFGKGVTNQAKQLMSEAKKGINHPKFKGYYCYDGLEYATPNLLAEIVGSYPKKVSHQCKNNLDGFSFRPVNNVNNS